MLVALHVHLGDGECGVDPTELLTAQAEPVGRLGRRSRQVQRVVQLTLPRRDERGDAPVAGLVGDDVADGVSVALLDRRLGEVELAGLDVGSGLRHPEQGHQAHVGGPPAHGLAGQLQVPERLERLAVRLVVLVPRPFDERRQRSVRIGVSPLDPLQPHGRVLGSGEAHQTDEQLQHPHGIRLDALLALFVQPQAHGTDRVVRDLGHVHRPADARPQDPPGSVSVTDGHRVT